MVELANETKRIGHGENSLQDAGGFMNRSNLHEGTDGSNYALVDGSVRTMSFWQTLVTESGTTADPGWSILSMWDSNR